MGWDVQVRRDESKEEQFKEKIGGAAHTLAEQLEITDELANKLTLAGGFNPEMIVDMPSEYIASALEITPEAADAILSRAQSLVSGGEAVTSND
jgi:N utilization substance protein A